MDYSLAAIKIIRLMPWFTKIYLVWPNAALVWLQGQSAFWSLQYSCRSSDYTMSLHVQITQLAVTSALCTKQILEVSWICRSSFIRFKISNISWHKQRATKHQAESLAFSDLQCFNIFLAAAVISLFDLVTGERERTSDRTQRHPSEVLTVVRGATDFHPESAVRIIL